MHQTNYSPSLSGIVNFNNKFSQYIFYPVICEYCGHKDKVSSDILSCTECGAAYNLLHFIRHLNNTRTSIYYNEYMDEKYSELARKVILNSWENIFYNTKIKNILDECGEGFYSILVSVILSFIKNKRNMNKVIKEFAIV